MTAFDRLKFLCDKQGISVNVLEERIGIGRNTLYSWKKKVPSGQNLTKVADYFHVSTDYLLGRTDNPTTEDELTENQKLVAYSIDPDVTDEEREAIINMVKEAMKFRRRI